LPLGGSEFVEPVEDHHRNDEAPEDHSRDEEPNSLSPTSGRNLFRRRRGSTDARLWHDFVSHDFARLVAEPTALASSTFRNSGHFRSPGAPGGCVAKGVDYSFLLSSISELLSLTKTGLEQSGPRF
jgi:hypothetical protein